MSEDDPAESSANKTPRPEGGVPPHKKGLSPELRRFLGAGRTRDEPREPAKASAVEPEEPQRPRPERATPKPSTFATEESQPASILPGDLGGETEGEETQERRSGQTLISVGTDKRASMQVPVLILGGIALLGLTFYVGKKFDHWRYMVQAASPAKVEPGSAEDKYPNLSADQLVVQALMAEKRGDRQDAADRLLAAKHKNLGYRGIFFRVGKMAYDAADFDGADKLFERAVAFGEDPASANYFRGLIAIRHKDLAAAQRSFEAAATSDPFTAQYQYYLAEALRIDHHPNEAIPRYERARLLAVNEQDAAVCEFKMRMALLEAGEAPKVAAEIERKRSVGDLPVDWLMTAAALKVRQGQAKAALPLIAQARGLEQSGLFVSCREDIFLVDAAAKNPEIAAALREPSEIPAPTP
jgi:tetratricopeptide (TPR) repeat protein